MSDQSHIQWTDATWNTISGCTRTSEGCLRCYIDRTPPFRMAHRKFDSPEIGGKTGVILHEDRLDLPLRWRNPRRVFVNSLSDMFHKDVPDAHIAAVFATMARAPQHTFQLLTKRAGRMHYLLGHDGQRLIEAARDEATAQALYAQWPLPNLHVGVSVESQKWADIRIPLLADREVKAAVKFLSVEPLIEPVDLHLGHRAGSSHTTDLLQSWDRVCLDCSVSSDEDPTLDVPYFEYDSREASAIGWIIVGGESGPGARPCEPSWIRSVVSQARAAGTPAFVKQMGSVWARQHAAMDRKGGAPDEWPADLIVREFPRMPQAVA